MTSPVRQTNPPARTRQATSPAPLAQPWDPFRELEQLHTVAEQLMESVWSGAGNGHGLVWAPPVDIEETEDAWIVEAEVPGVNRKDVNVEMRDSELVITGEIKDKERKGILRRRTRRVGQFEFRVTLPGDTDPDKIDANIKDGVLAVRIPKAERSRSRSVEVGAG
jgi:HSP20 family protein